MAVWQLSESRGLGGSDRVWRLSREGDGLTIGRAAYCDIQILSQSVEKKHSVIKWDERKGSYVIHDLGSSNGTFLNDLPLSSGVATLRHGDVLRFSYDKGHLFHVEKVERPSSPPAVSSGPPQHHQPSPPPSTPISTSSLPTPPPQVCGGVQYVSIASPSPSILLPAGQPLILPQPIYAAHLPHIGHVTGHMTTSSPLVTGYVSPYGSVVPSTPLPSTPLHLLPSYPLTPTTPHPPPSTTSVDVTSSSPSPAAQSRPPPGGDLRRSASIERPSASGGKAGGSAPPRPRRDGRRAVSLSSANMPRLSGVSSLYGSPSWWTADAEEDVPVVTKAGGSSPRKPAKRGESQILRNISPPPLSQVLPQQLTNRASDGREGEVGETSSDLETNPSAAWTVEAGPQRSRGVPAKWRRHVRSADSSPIRTPHGNSGGKNRSISPNIAPIRSSRRATASVGTSGKEFTPLSRKMTAGKQCPTPSSGPRQRGRPGTSPARRAPRTGSPRAPGSQHSTGKENSEQERLEIVAQPTVRGEKPSSTEVAVASGALDSSPPPDDPSSSGREHSEQGAGEVPVSRDRSSSVGGDLRSQSESLLNAGSAAKKVDDETFLVTSPTDEDEGRASSARKTWNSQPHQNSLMMASIEARMKRLNQMAQKSFLSLSSLEQGGASSTVCDSPLAAARGDSDTHHMPEWKFFDKEVDSIFKSIRSVEKWLKDIDATIGRLWQKEVDRRKVGGGEEEGEGEAGSELVVDSNCSSESEGTELHDSLQEGDCAISSD